MLCLGKNIKIISKAKTRYQTGTSFLLFVKNNLIKTQIKIISCL